MDPQELVPLEAGLPNVPRVRHQSRNCNLAARSCYRAPLRLCRLLALMIVLPTLFILVPLYMRYRVFLGQMYPMSMTDMRLIDSKISPTWCQRQVVRSNATFNAFVLPGHPEMSQELVPVSMTRELELEDDMKEYWGFYLLKGSSVTVSACTRWPGSSLIMIKGYKHLQECAYIGDDSSEELDELMEAYNLGLMNNTTLMKKIEELKKVDGKANDPGTMRRQKAGVSFHDPNTVGNVTSSENVPNLDVTDHDPKELREILEHLHAIRQAAKDEQLKFYHPPSHLMQLPALHRHRDANVDKDERRWLSFKDIDGKNSEVVTKEDYSEAVSKVPLIQTDKPIITKVNYENHTTTDIPTESTDKEMIHNSDENTRESHKNVEITKDGKENINLKDNEHKIDAKVDITSQFEKSQHHDGNKVKFGLEIPIETTVKEMINNSVENTSESHKNVEITTEGEENNNFEDNENRIDGKEDITSQFEKSQHQDGDKVDFGLKEVETDYETPTVNSEPNSKEVFEDVLKRLQALGDRGKRVLAKLHETMGVDYNEQEPKKSDIMASVQGSSEELDRLRKVLVEAIDEEKTKSQRQQKRRDSMLEARAKRELMLGQIELQKQLNEDDEARDYAAEEGLAPDGFAEHHSQVNETTAFDMSNSEFWSSFSSSEEALLECDGLILNLPLTPHSGCRADASEDESFAAARANALTYRVPANGYYFFVFNSENEVQRNFIRARFDLQKTRYDVARSKLRECTNSTERCELPLDIFSSQKVVLELPLRNNDSLWNEQFVIISECEPRTSIYLFCVLAVPILIMVFAFQ